MTKLRHDAGHWQQNSRGFSFAAEDEVDVVRFNRILWKGMKGRGVAYPTARDRREPRRSRERLLKEYYKGEGVVRAHLSRKRQTFEIDFATLNGKLADDTSGTALAFVTNGIALCIGLGGGVAYFLSQEGTQAEIPEGSQLVLIFNQDREVLTHLTHDRQQYLIRDQIHCERSKRWSPKVSSYLADNTLAPFLSYTGKSQTLPSNQLSRRRVKSDEGTAKRRGMSRPLPHTSFMKI